MAEVLKVHDIVNEHFAVTKILYQARTYNIYTVSDKREQGRLFQLTEFKLAHIPRKKGPFKEEEFRAEVDMLKALSHSLLPTVLEGFFDGENAYIVLSHCDGITLERYISMNISPLGVDESIERIAKISEALKYLYEKPVPLPFIHIDPAHICISGNGDMMIIGFGLHIFLDHYLSSTNPDIWCAPEIAEGHAFSLQSAIYSLGSLLYYCLTKQKWNATGRGNLKPRELNDNIPEGVQEALLVALSRRAEQRYLDIDTLLRKLRNEVSPSPSVVDDTLHANEEKMFIRESRVMKSTVKRAASFVAAFVVLLVIGVLFLPLLRNTVRKGESQYAYVLCEGKRIVNRIDLRSGKCTRSINFSGVARSIALSPDGTGLYVPQNEKSVNVFDASGGMLMGTYTLNGSPFGLIFKSEKPVAFVLNDADPFITVWNTDTHEAVGEIATKGPQTCGYLSHDIDILVVLDIQQNEIILIDSKTRSLIATFAAGDEPCDCTIDRSGRYIVVPSLTESLYLFNMSSRSLVKSIVLEKGKKHVYPSSGEVSPCVYVTCETGNQLSIVDLTAMKVTKKAVTKGTPVAIRVSPDGKTIYVLTTSPNCISVHDGKTLGLLREIMPGLSDPDSFEVWP